MSGGSCCRKKKEKKVNKSLKKLIAIFSLNKQSKKQKSPLNPLTANDELSRHENLTFLWTWILRWVPRSFATHASLCNALSTNKLCPKTVKILAVKGLNSGQIFLQ